MSSESVKIITVNRKARHDYFVVQTFEAGIVLLGTEVKACRQNKDSPQPRGPDKGNAR